MTKNKLSLAEALAFLSEKGDLHMLLYHDYLFEEDCYAITLNSNNTHCFYKMIAYNSVKSLGKAIIYMANNLDKLKIN